MPNPVEQANLKSSMMMSRMFAAVIACLVAVHGTAQESRDKVEAQPSRIPKERIPPAPPLTPEEALKQFKLQPGFRIELVASEPMVESPVVNQFDPDGRLWVVEMRSYMPNPNGLGEDKPVGRISILEDTDGDGRMDRKTIFLDGLVMPRALLLVGDGALVSEPPQLWFYPNHHGQPGERLLVAADFARDADPKLGARVNPEHAGCSLLLALDNWIYSLNHPFRYRLVKGRWEREPTPQRAQWGLAQDDFGRLFYTANSDQLRGDLVPSHYFGPKPPKSRLPGIGVQIAHDQSVWPARMNPGVNRGYQPDTLRDDGTLAKFTAACGTCVYRGDLLPRDCYGNAFVCEPAANMVRRNILTEQDGTVTARNACEKTEFLASTDEIFRPVNVATGPDGALYVVDMYHGIIEHRLYLTPYLRAQIEDRHLDQVAGKGRIWRIVPEGKRSETKVALSKETPLDLVKRLAHPNGWWRDTAQRLLVERNDPSVVPALQQLAAGDANPVARLHALWTLEGMREVNATVVEGALRDSNGKVRAAAVRLAEGPLTKSAVSNAASNVLRDKILKLATDASIDVQLQLALTLGLLPPDENTKTALANLARNGAAPLVRQVAAFTMAGSEPKEAAPPAAVQARPLNAEEKRRFEAGKTMYEVTCLACHQVHGLGQPGLAPPLVGSEWVAGPDTRLVRIVLNGLRGPIKVKGESFELDMPSLGVLDDDQIAAALTYVRREWGHTFEPVTPATVKKVREETAAREDAWTMADLLKVP